MNHRRYLIPIALAAFLSWISWLLVIIKIDPYLSTKIALILFFLTLFSSLVCTFTIIGFIIRRKVSHNEILFSYIGISLRQAILLTFCALGSLFFLLLGVLTWWDGFLLVLIASLIEFYISSSQ